MQQPSHLQRHVKIKLIPSSIAIHTPSSEVELKIRAITLILRQMLNNADKTKLQPHKILQLIKNKNIKIKCLDKMVSVPFIFCKKVKLKFSFPS